MSKDFKMLAKTFYGFEPVLAKELRNLGAKGVKEGVRNVSFIGDTGFMYKANLSLRTALRILKPIRQFRVRNEDELYDRIQQIKWENYLLPQNNFAVDAVVHSTRFNNSHYVALKVKDAIVDGFRRRYNSRPGVDTRHPDLLINIHIKEDQCIVSFDSSGGSLHRRGYRSSTNIAPINEVFAAGLILMSGYDGTQHFIDPMCGSGTLLIEAAMIATNIPPNLNRPEFGFEKWMDYDEDLFKTIYEAQMDKVRSIDKKIIGYDKAPSAIRKAKENINNAGLSDFIEVEQKDFFTSSKPVEGPTIVCFNPPYGERLKINVPEFYKKIGDTLKQGYPGTKAWFITSDFDTGLKSVGLRTSRKIKVFNGKLECRYVQYELYEGSKKAKKNHS